MADWQKTEEGYVLTEYNCPYFSIGLEHAEICTFDKELILKILDSPIQQHSCMLNGADCCEFTFATADASSN